METDLTDAPQAQVRMRVTQTRIDSLVQQCRDVIEENCFPGEAFLISRRVAPLPPAWTPRPPLQKNKNTWWLQAYSRYTSVY